MAFFGVYLLKNLTSRDKVYVGFTVDPNRRIQQHNRGMKFGGAKKTSGKGPWAMVLVVYGFPNEFSALSFEWAWQNPMKSRLIRHQLENKRTSESNFDYHQKILETMLRTMPWNGLALTVHWIDSGECYSSKALEIPSHMTIMRGPLDFKKKNVKAVTGFLCISCFKPLHNTHVACYHSDCCFRAHPVCCINQISATDVLIPVEIICPLCSQSLKWSKMKSDLLPT